MSQTDSKFLGTFKSLDATLRHAELALIDAQAYSEMMARTLGRGLCRTGGDPEFYQVAEWCHEERMALKVQSQVEAAAPQLLEALEEVLGAYVRLANSGDAGFWDCEQEGHVIKSRAAIKAARGPQ